jgi:uncharacterized cupredoxin-like copper-binding protein
MSKDTKESPSMTASWKAPALSVAALLAVGLTAVAPASAQDATPAAAGECVAPDLAAGAPSDASDSAADEADASPEAEDFGTPAEGAEAEAILAAASNIVACVIGGDIEGAVALMTPGFLADEFDTDDPNDVVESGIGNSFDEFEASDPIVYSDGSVSVDVQYWASEVQYVGQTWTFVQDGDFWKIDESEDFVPEFDGDAAVVGVNLTETENEDGSITYAIAPNAAAVVQPEVLIFHAFNAGVEDHEIIMMKLPEGADPAGILDGTLTIDDIELLGQVSVDAGDQNDMVLIGLEPGVYTLACFVSDADGMPHIANGMVTQFEVLAPS